MNNEELKTLERKLFLQYFEDGFWDIYLGLIILSFGLTILLDMGYLAGIVGSLGVLIPRIGKSRITYPRIGYIKFKTTRKKYLQYILLGALVMGVVLFLLFIGGQEYSLVTFLREYVHILIALIWAGIIASIAAFANVDRFFLYAGFVFICILISGWAGSMGINLTFSGMVIIIIGVVVLIKFMAKYPIISSSEE